MKNFDIGWKFKRGMFSETTDISGWETVTLPHDFAIDLPFAGKSDYNFEGTTKEDWEGNAAGGYLALGKGCYAKDFSVDLPERYRAFMVFEGIYRNSTVYMNGTEIYHQSNGYMGFEVDITDHLAENNRLFIKVDNSRADTSRWYTGSGIYRHVYLDLRPECYPYDVFISTPSITDEVAKIHISGKLTKPGCGAIAIFDPNGNKVGAAEFADKIDLSIDVNSPIRWDIDSPNLYKAIISISGEEFTYRFGIRTIELLEQKGMFLNGRRIMCKGFNIHHDLGVCGAPAFDSIIRYRLEYMKKMGVNALRLSHNPHAPKLLDMCDELGILVFDECFDKLNNQYVDNFEETWKQELEVFIKRDWNHPSVFIWSVGNETDQQRFDGEAGAAYIKNMADFVKSVDPTRPATCAQYPSRKNGVAWYDDNFRESEPAEMCESTDICSCNYTWDFFADDLKKHPEYIFIQSEAHIGSENLCGWNELCALPSVCGQFYWGGIDYLGEAVSETNRGWWRGFLDLTCNKRPLAYQVEAAFKDSPVIHIGICGNRADMLWNDASLEWAFVFDHWNWEPDRELDIVVYSNAKSVKLFLNDNDMGECKYDGCFNFKTKLKYEPGELVAVGYDESGNETCRHTLRTAGKPVAICLNPTSETIAADGTDAVAVDVELFDDAGTLCQKNGDMVSFELQNGIFAGIGNADLCTEIPYGTKEYPVFLGRAQAVIRADGSGKGMTLRVKCDGLTASIDIPVV